MDTAAFMGSSTHQRQTCTPAGISQEFWANRLTKQVNSWNRNALKDLLWIMTDKGPLQEWLHKIKKAEGNRGYCQKENKPLQNAAHILQCK